MNAFEDPYVFTATSSDAPLISETVGDDDYWSGIAQGDDEYSDVDDQAYMYGFFKNKCIVLYDTLIQQFDTFMDASTLFPMVS
ncbi:hypothetical protein C5167_025464 [Papaver somniferum]|uniref:Uncharacterized protein n=1 Tax=Papaver somniferum TaxID=3469 RepID=A0A4Y7JUP7_PAPSO|nr:hypothetical protein C5167_025464 [Papaver somniferum]